MGVDLSKQSIWTADGSEVGENLLSVNESSADVIKNNGTHSFDFQGWVSNFYNKTWMNNHLINGEKYVLSYKVTCIALPDLNTYSVSETRHSPILVHQGGGWNQITTTNDGIKTTDMQVGESRIYTCSFTFSTITESPEYYGLCGYTCLYRNANSAVQYAKFRISDLKLEKGSTPTPWIPNPTDNIYISSTVPFVEETIDHLLIGDGYITANNFYEI